MKQLEFTDQEPSTAFEPARIRFWLKEKYFYLFIRSCRSCPENGDGLVNSENEKLNGWSSSEIVLTPGT